jgi:hypothetical protein
LTGSSAGVGLADGLLERHRAGDLERHLRGVDVVRRTVEQRRLDAHERVAREHAELHRALDAASTDGMYSRGMRPPLTLFSNSYSSPSDGSSGAKVICTLAYWPEHRSASCACSRSSRRPTDRLAVGHLRLADVRLDLELAAHAVHQDVQVELTHAGDLVWPVSSLRLTRNVGSSSASFWMAVESFSWSPLVFGSIATEMTGSGNVIDSRTMGFAGSRQGLAGGGVLEADERVDVARAGLVDRVLLVGVHLEELADALLLALGGVDHLGTGGDLAGVHPDVGELAEEGVRGDLERQRGERLVVFGSRMITVSSSRTSWPSIGGTSSGDGR